MALMETQNSTLYNFRDRYRDRYRYRTVEIGSGHGIGLESHPQGNLIPRKAKTTPSWENITPEVAEWAEAIVKRVLQAA
jgi:hypothetical protein